VVITIDGPSGAGKSTVARKLANKLGFIHLNSGALFRAVALKALSSGLEVDKGSVLASLAQSIDFRFELDETRQTRLFVDGRDESAQLASEQAGRLASSIGVFPELREVLLNVQRQVGRTYSIVVEGRDAGSVVFPDAEAKFYLDAPLEVRATRRLAELRQRPSVENASKENANYEEVKAQMLTRDHRDSTREVAPNVKPQDAILIDTSSLSADEVVEKILGHVRHLIT